MAAERRDFLQYSSAFERQCFNSEELDPLQVLMAIGPNANQTRFVSARLSISQFITEISEKVEKISDEGKKIKFLTAEVPKRFLKTYVSVTHFSTIFETGEYNCVSATALYALILDKLSIPYIIKETPNHVYLVAYPSSSGILIESTMPKNGYYMPKSKEVESIVELLMFNDLITEDEIKQNGHLSIFSKYFYSDKVISLRELTGLQYFNEALMTIRAGNPALSFAAIDKADFLNNTKEVQLVKLSIVSELLSKAKYTSYFDAYCVAQYANLDGAKTSNVHFSYRELIDTPLMRSNDKQFADSVFAIMNAFITDEEKLNEVKVVHYGFYSRYYQLKYNEKKATKYAELAYQANPNDVFAQTLYVHTLIQQVMNNDDLYEDEYIDALSDALADKPELKKHNMVLIFYFNLYCFSSNESYFDNDEEQGQLYFDKALETFAQIEDNSIVDMHNYGRLYAEAGAYYYRKNNLTKALEFVQEGLKHVPDHQGLKTKLCIIRNKMDQTSIDCFEEEEDEFIHFEFDED